MDIHKNSLKKGYNLHWYTIERVLGQGGFGITYLAYDTNLEQKVALKEFLPSEIAIRSDDLTIQPVSTGEIDHYEAWLKRFLNEARTLAQFDHPNIVRVYSVFEANNTAYMIMRYEQGEALNRILKRQKYLPEEEILQIVIPILDGLGKMHEKGFIHRDIQPANIYIRHDSSPVLLDFGATRQTLGNANTLTILVTPGYAPYEQYYSSSSEQGPWTDIYGLGATLYRSVAGVSPIDAIERSKSMLAKTKDALIPAKIVGEGRYSETFLNAIDHALEFNEKDRPQSILEWLNELQGNATSNISKNINDIGNKEEITQINEYQDDKNIRTNNHKTKIINFDMSNFFILILGISIGIFILGYLTDKNILDFINEHELTQTDIQKSSLSNTPVDTSILEGEIDKISKLKNELAEIQKLRETEEQRLAKLEQERIQKEKDAEEARLQAEEQKKAEQQRLAKLEQERIQKEKDAEEARLQAEEQKKAEQQRLAKLEQERIQKEKDAEEAKNKNNNLNVGLTEIEKGNYATALKLLLPLAENGNAIAQHNIALLYRTGKGVIANDTVALKFMKNAAWGGQKNAQAELGLMYEEGVNGIKDPFLAYTWFLVAERNGIFTYPTSKYNAEKQLQIEQLSQAHLLATDIFNSQKVLSGN